jgi:hypothetical protein
MAMEIVATVQTEMVTVKVGAGERRAKELSDGRRAFHSVT